MIGMPTTAPDPSGSRESIYRPTMDTNNYELQLLAILAVLPRRRASAQQSSSSLPSRSVSNSDACHPQLSSRSALILSASSRSCCLILSRTSATAGGSGTERNWTFSRGRWMIACAKRAYRNSTGSHTCGWTATRRRWNRSGRCRYPSPTKYATNVSFEASKLSLSAPA